MYAEGLPAEVRLKAVTKDGRLPFVFEASGSETHFTNGYDPNPRTRRVFAFPQPATLARSLRDAIADLAGNVWDWAIARPADADPTTTDDTQGTDDAEGDLLLNTFGATAMPTGTVPSDIAQADVTEQGSDTEQDEEEPFLNRAERRAQQRGDRRNQQPRPLQSPE